MLMGLKQKRKRKRVIEFFGNGLAVTFFLHGFLNDSMEILGYFFGYDGEEGVRYSRGDDWDVGRGGRFLILELSFVVDEGIPFDEIVLEEAISWKIRL